MEENKLISNPYVCNRGERVIDVLKELTKRGHLSAPVLNKRKDSLIGFIDLADIVLKFTQKITNKDVDYDYYDLLDNDDKFKDLQVYEIINEKRNPRIILGKNHTLYFVLEIFTRDHNIHRIPIVDNNDKLINLITQRQIIQYLYENINNVGSNSKRPIHMFRNSIKYVHCIKEEDEAIKGFQLMTEKEIGGVGVLNNKNEIIGTISLQDLKIIVQDKQLFRRLYKKKLLIF